MGFTIIAFDADDTLWHAEVLYQEAQEKLTHILSGWEKPERVDKILLETEMRNIPQYGFGVKSFVLSMIEAAIQISDGEIGADLIEEILQVGRSMLTKEIQLIPHVKETIHALYDQQYRMMVITMGDLLDQNDKLTRSGLAPYFSIVEVVSEKSVDSYGRILEKYQIEPQSLIMVGNSIRSDILPTLALGGTAVHIPANTTWAHEMVSDFNPPSEGFYQLEDITELPALLASIESM